MTIPEFKRELANKSDRIGPGAEWRRADFHVHFPTSHDYEYKGGDSFNRLAQELSAQQLDYAVLLKHQELPTREELAKLQQLCPRITLIPGAEINVLVDALFKKIGKDYFFHCIVAVDPRDLGDYSYVLRTAIEKYQYRDGEYPAGFRSSILDVGQHFREKGALFIPAHLHQSKPPENSRSVDDLYNDDAFLSFIKGKAFDALEVRQKQTAVFFDGQHLTDEGQQIPRATCVSSSDAHHHDHLAQRKRFSWVRVEQPTFAELKAALSLPHRVTLDSPAADYPRVIGLHVVGSFVKECWLNLNDGLNALIGSKGSGKTALLECLRFVLNTPIPKERSESVAKHLEHILGSSGYVECLVRNTGGTEQLITRRADSPGRIAIVDENNETLVRSPNAGAVFPVSILGWHEIESVADRASARIDLLDRVGEPAIIRDAYEKIRSLIERARDQLPLLQRHVRRLDSSLKQLWELQRKRATLSRLAEGDLSSLQEQYEWFLLTEQRVNAITEATIRRRIEVADAIASHLEVDFAPPPAMASVVDLSSLLAKVAESAVLNKSAEASAAETLNDALEQLRASAQAVADSLMRSFTDFRDVIYTPKVNALPAEDREVLSRQIQVLEETKRLPTVESTCSEQLRELKVLAQELLDLCDGICQLREVVVTAS